MNFDPAINQLYSGNYKRLLIIPAILFIVLAGLAFVSPGVQPGIDLKGGTVLIMRSNTLVSGTEVADFLKTKFNLHDIAVTSSSNGSTYGLIIEFSDVITGQEDFGSKLQQSIQQKFNLPSTTAFQFQQIAPAVGAIFWQTSITVTLAAIILLLLVVFFLFREFVPALAIILAGLFDVLAGLAAMPFFGISLSLPTISALLMLMGYSIDTDVLSASRVLKGVGKTSREQAVSSFKTGMMMTITALAAVLVMAVFSYFNQMIAIYEIGIVLFFGLIGDIIATWLMNMPILLWFVESKAAKKKSQR